MASHELDGKHQLLEISTIVEVAFSHGICGCRASNGASPKGAYELDTVLCGLGLFLGDVGRQPSGYASMADISLLGNGHFTAAYGGHHFAQPELAWPLRVARPGAHTELPGHTYVLFLGHNLLDHNGLPSHLKLLVQSCLTIVGFLAFVSYSVHFLLSNAYRQQSCHGH